MGKENKSENPKQFGAHIASTIGQCYMMLCYAISTRLKPKIGENTCDDEMLWRDFNSIICGKLVSTIRKTISLYEWEYITYIIMCSSNRKKRGDKSTREKRTHTHTHNTQTFPVYCIVDKGKKRFYEGFGLVSDVYRDSENVAHPPYLGLLFVHSCEWALQQMLPPHILPKLGSHMLK